MKTIDVMKIFKEQMQRHNFVRQNHKHVIPDEVIEADKIIYRCLMEHGLFNELEGISNEYYKELCKKS